jgi:hypothetical protein
MKYIIAIIGKCPLHNLMMLESIAFRSPGLAILAMSISVFRTQALVSFKKYVPLPLPYFKVNICPFPLTHFASIFFAYL